MKRLFEWKIVMWKLCTKFSKGIKYFQPKLCTTNVHPPPSIAMPQSCLQGDATVTAWSENNGMQNNNKSEFQVIIVTPG